ncbi:hypothetical protein ISS05_03320 [Candidatus Woesearchaeota archaeon]|nr:hypothetical protein [Candidatus Woesearchaeota archaeon]
MLNKKGIVEDWLPLMLLIVVLVFLFFITMILKIGSEREQIELFDKEQDKIMAQQLLVGYLRSPFSTGKNLADAINEYYLTRNQLLLDEIKRKTGQFFSGSELEEDTLSWDLTMNLPSGEEIEITPLEREITPPTRAFKIINVAVDTPTSTPNKIIRLNLWVFYTKILA